MGSGVLSAEWPETPHEHWELSPASRGRDESSRTWGRIRRFLPGAGCPVSSRPWTPDRSLPAGNLLRMRPSSRSRTRLAIVGATTLVLAAAGSAVAQYPIAPSGMKATFAFGLKSNTSGAQAALLARATPGSPTFRQWMSLPSVSAQFGASRATRTTVTRWFTSRGFTVRMRGANTVALVTGTAGAWTTVTGRRMQWMPNEDGKDLPGSAVEARGAWKLPSPLKGLITQQVLVSNTSRPWTPPKSSREAGMAPGAREHAGTNPDFPAGAPANVGTWNAGCPDAEMGRSNYAMSQVATAYDIPQDVTTTIGVFSLGGGITTRSLRAAEQCFGWPGTKLRSVKALGASALYPEPKSFEFGFDESQLDAQVVRGLLPGASLVDYQAWGSPDDMWQLPLAALDDTSRPDVVSMSDGTCESYVTSTTRALWDRLVVRLGLVGTTTVIANDDTGAFACGITKPAPAWPATDPWVLSVGGTRLVVDVGNRRTNEVAWNDFAWLTEDKGGGATGGGISRVYARPSWQAIGSTGQYAKRTVPDVSAHASRFPGFPVVLQTKNGSKVNTQYSWNSGNSAAAPLVAVQVAVAAVREEQAGRPTPGFVTPFLYARYAAGPGAFLDVVEGNNSVPDAKVPGYSAAPGYDLVTGMGVITPAVTWGG